MAAQQNRVLVHVFRRDLRVSDQPVLHHLESSADHGFTHFLPLYVFPAHQIDLRGLLQGGAETPYPVPRSRVGGYPRCGPHRAKFLAEAVWGLKGSLESLGSGLLISAGMIDDVVRHVARDLTTNGSKVAAIWMTSHEGTEEKSDESTLASVSHDLGAEFKLWHDEKYFIDDRDLGLENLEGLSDIFTTYCKSQEPLREKPRPVLPAPAPGSLPPLPEHYTTLGKTPLFSIPETAQGLIEALVQPVKHFLPNTPAFPDNAESAHPFTGGETAAQARLKHFVQSGCVKTYKETRKGLLGTDSSTKLSAYLAQGCITSRQIHDSLLKYENGTDKTFENANGYGAGENEGTIGIRWDLMWRDYMRLCHQKFKNKIFRLEGIKVASGGGANEGEQKKLAWKTPIRPRAAPDQDPTPDRVAEVLKRFNSGTTGIGLIDASQRELIHTGYTSNRARQNVANFLAKQLGIDWRYGAEWYEMLLVDYDVSSNWANWQYVAGVGNDPRSEIRTFNPIKQAFDYDKDGQYVRSWVPEVRSLAKLENVFQAWTASDEDLRAAGLEGNVMVTDPIKRIQFSVNHKPDPNKRKARGRRRSTRGSMSGHNPQSSSRSGSMGGPGPGPGPASGGWTSNVAGGNAFGGYYPPPSWHPPAVYPPPPIYPSSTYQPQIYSPPPASPPTVYSPSAYHSPINPVTVMQNSEAAYYSWGMPGGGHGEGHLGQGGSYSHGGDVGGYHGGYQPPVFGPPLIQGQQQLAHPAAYPLPTSQPFQQHGQPFPSSQA